MDQLLQAVRGGNYRNRRKALLLLMPILVGAGLLISCVPVGREWPTYYPKRVDDVLVRGTRMYGKHRFLAPSVESGKVTEPASDAIPEEVPAIQLPQGKRIELRRVESSHGPFGSSGTNYEIPMFSSSGQLQVRQSVAFESWPTLVGGRYLVCAVDSQLTVRDAHNLGVYQQVTVKPQVKGISTDILPISGTSRFVVQRLGAPQGGKVRSCMKLLMASQFY